MGLYMTTISKIIFWSLLVICLVCVCNGCSQSAAKKTSYRKSGPVNEYKDADQIKETQITIEAFGTKYRPTDISKQITTTKPAVATELKKHPSKSFIIITRQGDVLDCQIKGE